MAQFFDEQGICTLDALSGRIIMRLPSDVLVFKGPDDFEMWLTEKMELLPKLRSGHAGMTKPLAREDEPADEDGHPLRQGLRDWIVSLEEIPPDRSETIRIIVELTGWAFTTSELEVLAGAPITLGAGLTLHEATQLQAAFGRKGLIPAIMCMGGGDYGAINLNERGML